MKAHRAEVARGHRGRGREVIGVDWTQAHHERGPRIYGVKEAYVWEELRTKHPESFRSIKAKGRNGEERQYWVFTKVVRLKRYGRK